MRRLLMIFCVLSLVLFLTVSAMARTEAKSETIAKILAAEDNATYQAELETWLLDDSLPVQVRHLAAKAIGHIGDPAGSPALVRALKNDQIDRAVVCAALGWLWTNTPAKAYRIETPPEVLKALLAVGKSDPSLKVRAAAYTAIALGLPQQGQKEAGEALVDLTNFNDNPDAAELLIALVRVAAQERPKKSPIEERIDQRIEQTMNLKDPREAIFAAAFASSNPRIVYHAAYFAGRKQTFDLPLEDELIAAFAHNDPSVRVQALQALRRRDKIDQAVKGKMIPMLAKGTMAEKIAAVQVVAEKFPPEKALDLLKKTLGHAGAGQSTGLHQAIFESLATIKEPAVVEFLLDVSQQKVPYARLARLAAAQAGAKEQLLAQSPERFSYTDADALHYVDVLAALEAYDRLEWLLKGEGVPERFVRSLSVRQSTVMALAYDRDFAARSEMATKHPEWRNQADPFVRSIAAETLGATKAAEALEPLLKLWERAGEDRGDDAALAVLSAMETIVNAKNSPAYTHGMLGEVARQGIDDRRLTVRRKAAQVLYDLTREIHKAPLYGACPGRSLKDYRALAERLADGQREKKLLLQTDKGDITLIVRYDLAPLTAENFVRLASTGFYDNLVFHRVVPLFVAQGGDPAGLGWGGPGYTIRDEEGVMPFEVGVLGMASAGHDTAGSQFFITTVTAPHLDGLYTAFGKVEGDAALATVQKIAVGDRILSIKTDW
ncbi:MAG TPA: peptidylprolyl isomerase [bacterium]|nr:peptidylprolyl isomerase [bacterium]